MKFNNLLFGTAGTPICCKERSSLAGIKKVRELNLDAMELEFVRGVRMNKELAAKIKEEAQKNKVHLTAHGPYYINLNSLEPAKIDASIKRIMDTAIIANAAGAYSITFHAAYYMKQEADKVYLKVKDLMKKIIKKVQDQNINLWIRPETTGKGTQFGNFDELIKLSQDVEQVLPCIDFAHLHARSAGKQNTREEFNELMTKLEKGLGKLAINNMHIHMSGINYSDKGERNHLELNESDMNYKDLIKVLKEFNAKGILISESPNIESDASLMQKFYNKL